MKPEEKPEVKPEPPVAKGKYRVKVTCNNCWAKLTTVDIDLGVTVKSLICGNCGVAGSMVSSPTPDLPISGVVILNK